MTLIDERPALGGQYYKQLARSHAFSEGSPTDGQFREGGALIAEVAALGVRLLSGVLVWAASPGGTRGVSPRQQNTGDAPAAPGGTRGVSLRQRHAGDAPAGPGELAAIVAGRAQVFRPAQLILATGAYEAGVPVPGWTLPGFMTTGAAQTLLRAYRVAPGRRVLVAGNGPLNAQVACELIDAGVEVAAWVEAAPSPGWRKLPAALVALWHAPGLIRDGQRYLARLRRAGVPRLWGHLLVAAEGDEAVERATVAPLGRDGAPIMARARGFAVDAVCAGYGFLPANELSRLLKCRHRYEPSSASLVAERDADGATSVPGVFVAGDCARMEGARAAGEQGLLAGLAAARAMGKAIPADLAAEAAHGRRSLARHRRFQRALWSLFAAPRPGLGLASDDTLVCRCEEVTLGEAKQALGGGITGLGNLKRLTRAGMGPCQGRYCAPLLASLVAETTGEAVGDFSFFASRPPTKPVPVAAIARQKPDMPMPMSLDAPRAYGGAATAGNDLELETDVLVVGGGILGCAVAYYLARAGVEVILIERHDVSTHASGRNAGSLHVQIQSVFARRTDPVWVKGFDDQLPLFPLAVRTWKELAAELDDDIELKICGGLMVAETAEHMRFLEAKAKRERAGGLTVEVLGQSELRDVAPYLSKRLAGAEYCPDEGKVNPTLATPAVARAAEYHGARILRHTELLELRPTGEGFEARSSRGPIRCRRVVDAAGPWAAEVAAMVGVTIPVRCKTVQQIVTEPVAPFISHLVEHAERKLTMKQAAAGHVILGGGWPGAIDPETGYPEVVPAAIEGSLGTSVQVAPRLAHLRLLRAWSGINVEIDGKPALGPVPGVPGFHVAVAGTGYTLGPICAKLLAETLLGRTPSMDLEPFSIARFARA